MTIQRKNGRTIEIAAGLFIILSALSMIVATLLNFDYTIPNNTFADDVDFLTDSYTRQKISAIAWLITGSINILLLPLYLVTFQGYQKTIHLISSFLIIIMAYTFINAGINALQLARLTERSIVTEITENEVFTTNLLVMIKQVQTLLKYSMVAVGIFTTLFAAINYMTVRIPLFGTILALIGGPLVVLFAWINPEHIIMTFALASAWTALLITGTRIVNKGLLTKELNNKNPGNE
jgi:hypothetical protein